MSLNRVQIEKLKSLPWLDEIVAKKYGKDFLPFEEARTYVRSLGFKESGEWKEWSKTQRPRDIPGQPSTTYKDEWQGWGDWLGTRKSFEEARSYARSLGFKSQREWRDGFKTRPYDIPSHPDATYTEFISWDDWLGTRCIKGKEFRPFTEARDFARSLGLKSYTEWRVWCKTGQRPTNIPTCPWSIYKDEWIGWGDWIGTGRRAQCVTPRPFGEARDFVSSLRLPNTTAWCVWSKSNARPQDIPSNPRLVYKDEWVNWGDWLGTGKRAICVTPKPFTEARAYARSLGLKQRGEWEEWSKTQRPRDIPVYPKRVYKTEWVGWGDWLGTDVNTDVTSLAAKAGQ